MGTSWVSRKNGVWSPYQLWLFNKCTHSWGHSTSCLIYSVVIQVISEKSCVAKVLLAIWEIILHENNCSYYSYRFIYKFAFILILYFLASQKKRIRFLTSWWSGTEKYLCFLFIVSCALLQSHAECNRLL